MALEQQDLIDAFVTEANENLGDIENDLLAMEADGADLDVDRINRVFRGIHSMKGTAGYLGLKTIGSLAHEMENIFNLIRNGELVPTTSVVEVLLKSSDALMGMIQDVEHSNEVDVSEHITALAAAIRGGASDDVQECLNHEIDVELPNGTLAFMSISEHALVSRQRQGQHIYVLDADLDEDVERKERTPVEFLDLIYEHGELIDSYVNTAGIGTLEEALPLTLRLMLLLGSTSPVDELAKKLDVPTERLHAIATPQEGPWGKVQQATPTPATPEPKPQAATDAEDLPAAPKPAQAQDNTKTQPATTKPGVMRQETTLRVNVKVLDKLMGLAGELVLARNQLVQITETPQHRGLDSVSARVDQVTSELQDAIMQTRMQPVGSVFGKFARVVRDMCKTLGKQCEFATEGNDVELDKTIIEGIGDPLTHLVRNAIDHGMETPDQRTAVGKDKVGRLLLRAFHQGGKVNITISDDGRGMDARKIKAKAVSKGVITQEQAQEMNDRDALRLIFQPGFSTAEKVSDVSGRGVGMDVVRTNIESLGGTVEVSTEMGVGTRIEIRLPLTLAIIPSLVVRQGEEKFALPQVHILELIRVKPSEVRQRIERIQEAEVLRLRGSLLPLVRLNEALAADTMYYAAESAELVPNDRQNLADRRDDIVDDQEQQERRHTSDRREDTAAGTLNIIVVEAGTLRYGVVVDGLDDTQEIVVKPLGRHLKDCTCLAGATVLGDGGVALILDTAGIAAHCRLKMPESHDESGHADRAESSDELHTVLLVRNHPSEQFAISTSMISRIERIKEEQIDTVGGLQILQYRGASLPLLSLENHIDAAPRERTETLHVVVFHVSGREAGLVIPTLADIRDISTHLDTTTFREAGVLGSLIVDDMTTRVIDLVELCKQAHPDWYEDRPAEKSTSGTGAARILLAEDSSFFRNQVTSFLESAGFEVAPCADGQIAWNTLQDPEQKFDLVLTDIEMPNMTGLELASNISGDPQFAHLPIIALTTLAGEEDMRRGYAAGVNKYMVKLDRDELLAGLSEELKAVRLRAGGTQATGMGAVGSKS